MNHTDMKVLEFCCREVVFQKETPVHVFYMMEAWEYGQKILAKRKLSDSQNIVRDIQILGYKVDPYKNRPSRWRSVSVVVGPLKRKGAQAGDIPIHMTKWAEALPRMTAEEAYKEFEIIHPFLDGNGRVGKIIFNWRNDSLDRPEFPSAFDEAYEHLTMELKNEYHQLVTEEIQPFFSGDQDKAFLWMSTENPALGGMTPVRMIALGISDKLRHFIKEAMDRNKGAEEFKKESEHAGDDGRGAGETS